jgi:uncharacterized phiE125 gp8 family phage protein
MTDRVVTIVEPPAERMVTLDEAKAHLRVDHDDDDALIEAYILAAEQRIDGPRGICGRCFQPQKLRVAFHSFGECIELPFPPLISVDSITYLDSNGDEQTFAETGNWRVIGVGSEQGASIVPLYGVEWPSLLATADPDLVRVTFNAGYIATSSPENNKVPETVRAAVKLIVSDWYEFRSSTVIGTTAAPLPHGAEMLLAPYRTAGAYMAV